MLLHWRRQRSYRRRGFAEQDRSFESMGKTALVEMTNRNSGQLRSLVWK
jgi:hypothetical protein